MITTPFCLYDCDVPVDGSTAVGRVGAPSTPPTLDHPAVRVEAVGTALRGRPSWDQFDDLTTMAARDAGAQLWTRTDLTPADVDVAELYDGFSFLTMVWLEALGFCGKGEVRAVRRGRRAHRPRRRAARSTPTAASSRPAGCTASASSTRRACSCGARAASGRCPAAVEVAAVANGGGPIAGAMLLTRHR